ncbi:hypothetical protein EYS21_19780, partial [Arthrobacter sp. S39]
NQALIALARRRCDTLFAMLRDGTLYQAKHPQQLDEKHRDTLTPRRLFGNPPVLPARRAAVGS